MPKKVDKTFIIDKFKNYLDLKDREFWYIYAYQEPPFWKRFLFLGVFSAFLMKHFLVCLTKTELVLMQVSSTYNEKNTQVLDFSQIERINITNLVLGRFITISFKDGSEYPLKTYNKIGGIKDQAENLDKICKFLQQPSLHG